METKTRDELVEMIKSLKSELSSKEDCNEFLVKEISNKDKTIEVLKSTIYTLINSI